MRAVLRTLSRLEQLADSQAPARSLVDCLRQHCVVALLREHADGAPQPRLPADLSPSERVKAEAMLADWDRDSAAFFDRYPDYREVVKGG